MAPPSALRSTDLATPTGPAGHRGPRAAILLHLKERGQATARDLADTLGVSLNAVRHHLKELEAEGVVEYQREHHGVGAPAHAYQLSARGHALFPDRYERTVADLLDHLVATHGRPAALALLETHYRSLSDRIDAETRGMSGDRRGEVVARLLAAEGYMATWTATPGGGTLTEHNCPHRLVAERFPEICEAEEAFLARAFGSPVKRLSRIAGGCGTCSYHVAPEATEGEVTE